MSPNDRAEAGLEQAVAVVGLGAVLPDALDVSSFWRNVCAKRYSIREVPPERWRVEDYYDPDPAAPDKTYSKIGAWVQGFRFDSRGFRIPPRAAAGMDEGQQWALAAAAEALADYGWPERALDTERTGVILGAAMGGDRHLASHLRIRLPEYRRDLESAEDLRELPEPVREALLRRWQQAIEQRLPAITEDTMPGELANIASGRVASVFDLRGPSFTSDAACASGLAALATAVQSLQLGHCDAVVTGGVDHNMDPSVFVKFCKLGALSATGSRPFGRGADGFVMGEGCAVLLLKRLGDAERDGDRIHAVIRAVGASSDGRGKGITAPNPAGQRLALERAWRQAGLDPATVGLVEAHGTSTKVGDVVEAQTLSEFFAGAPRGSVALGSVKGNIGHLKAAAGAASLLKVVLALREGLLPPTLGCDSPNPGIDFERSGLVPSRELRPWTPRNCTPRRAAVCAYGFGGTNFHAVLEEHRPSLARARRGPAATMPASQPVAATGAPPVLAAPSRDEGAPRRILLLGAPTVAALREQAHEQRDMLAAAGAVAPGEPCTAAHRAPERLAIDYAVPAELRERLDLALRALEGDERATWNALAARGVFRGSGARPGKIAFLFPGQGSQYPNMGRPLCACHAEVAEVFAEADRVMAPILGRPLTELIFVDGADARALEQAEQALRETAVTQPAVLALDTAIARALGGRGIVPELVMGHSLGEYAALVAAGALPFADALEAVAARGREMSQVRTSDHGAMVAVFAPRPALDRILAQTKGYVALANINSREQHVIGGETAAVESARRRLEAEGFRTVPLPVSHAFHTDIVAPAAQPLRRVLDRLRFAPARVGVVANVTGELYPAPVGAAKDLLERQIAAPVQWVRGLETLYRLGARAFVEVGPKSALRAFVDDVLRDRPDVLSVSTNRPKAGQLDSLNHALCALFAAGYAMEDNEMDRPNPPELCAGPAPASAAAPAPCLPDAQLAEALGRALLGAVGQTGEAPLGSVVVSGTGLGLPGAHKPVMCPDNVRRILGGEQLIDLVPERLQDRMLDKRVTRLVKHEDGGGHFETIADADGVIQLAGRAGSFDLCAEYGVPEKLARAWDITTQLAVAAGLDALRESGIPLVRSYRRTGSGRQLPDRWLLPRPLRDETGVIFASAFPGLSCFAAELTRYHEARARRELCRTLEELRAGCTDSAMLAELHRRISEARAALTAEDFELGRHFLLRVLSLGHAQLAEHIGARGPNTHVNAACASHTQAVALGKDWIEAGRCRRVLVVSADQVTGDELLEWIGAGFLATGAAATDRRVADAALPFDRRRHGLVLGMGASALVVESEDAVRERGSCGITELVATEVRNSAYHATRLDPAHIAAVMESLVAAAERRLGISRQEMAPHLVFLSHETYTPARGGSASAEVAALRHVFGDCAIRVVICNTKGLTGHPMGVGIEDVVGVKALEHGVVPPVPGRREPDPELGPLQLSRGGHYPVRYALRLAAGFGSQVAMTLSRRIPGPLDHIADQARYERWLGEVTGHDRPQTEVVQRVLRVRDVGPPPRAAGPSAWRPGTRPMTRTEVGERTSVPAPLALALAQAPTWAPVAVSEPAPASVSEPPTAAFSEPPPASTPEPNALPAAAPAGPAEPLAAGDREAAVAAQVRRIVAEKTGYPEDMLELDLDLEADLGIDTVKQAETFSALRELFDIPTASSFSLRDYPTLRSVVRFVCEHRSGHAAPAQGGAAVPDPSEPAEPAAAESAAALAAADEAPRRVPVALLCPPVELCPPSGPGLDASSRVVVASDRGGAGAALVRALRERGAAVLELDPRLDPGTLETHLEPWLAAGPVSGAYWLPALDPEPSLAEIDLASWRGLTQERVKNLYRTMRALGTAPRFLVAGTRLGGMHGYEPGGALGPLGGAVAGFAKAYRRERPDTLVKVADFATDAGPEEVAGTLVAETLADAGSTEIGRRGPLRISIGMEEQAAPAGPGIELGPQTVFLVSGAAGSVTSAVVADLARTSGGIFFLLDRAPAPGADRTELEMLRSDREALKGRLIEQARARGELPTPKTIEQQLFVLERERAARGAIAAVQAAGGTAHYRQIDLLDAAAVDGVLEEIRRGYGRIDVLVHAAGVEASHELADKTPDEFDRVFDVKVDGLFNLLRSSRGLPLRAAVLFSSVAGRFGNRGQTDYSAANDLLCKMASSLRRERPETRALAIDWTAWEGAGMAARGSVPELLRQAGVELLPVEVGAATVRRELASGATGEIVVAQGLGALAAPAGATVELDEQAVGVWLDRAAGPWLAALGLRRARGLDDGSVELELELDPVGQPFLADHEVESGVPFLPGVVGAELLAETASLLAPGYDSFAIEGLNLASPVKFHRRERRTVRLLARAPAGPGADIVVHAALDSLRPAPRAELPAERRRHFSAAVRLRRDVPSPPALRVAIGTNGGRVVERDEIYRTYFHGPSFQVLEHVTLHGEQALGLLAQGLPAETRPAVASSLLAPRLVELCFQTAGMWELATHSQLRLPSRLDALAVHRPALAAARGRLCAVVTAQSQGQSFDAVVIDEDGAALVELRGYHTVELPRPAARTSGRGRAARGDTAAAQP